MLKARASSLVLTSEESRAYRCVVDYRKRYTMEEFKDFLLGYSAVLLRPYISGKGTTTPILPPGTCMLLRHLYKYAAHFFSADLETLEIRARKRAEAVQALHDYIDIVNTYVRCLSCYTAASKAHGRGANLTTNLPHRNSPR